MNNNKFDQFKETLLKDKKLRTEVVHKSFIWFCIIYFNQQILDPLAPFQMEMIKLAAGNETLVISAFRGSGKSTILNLLYALWAAIGIQNKKFILIVSQTETQAQLHFANIKAALEIGSLFKTDLGPFREEKAWNASTIILTNGTRISSISVEQNVRGLKHLQYRPDLIIADDIESTSSVQSAEQRDKTYNFLKSDLILAGDPKKLRIIILGNTYHQDCIIKRLEKEIKDHQFDGIYRSYPFLDEDGKCLWPSKFSTQADIDMLKNKLGNETTWMREMLLIPVPDEGQIIDPKWLRWYDASTDDYKKGLKYCSTIIAVDLAVSTKKSADCTAIIVLEIYKREGKRLAFVRAFPTNKRMQFPDTCNEIKNTFEALKNSGQIVPKIYIEQVGFQLSAMQVLTKDGLPIEGAIPKGDKEARLAMVSPYIKNGEVYFPQKGADELYQQLVGFGTEKHDDLADALAMALSKSLGQRETNFGVGAILDDGSTMINGKIIPPPKTYNYRGEEHTEPPEVYYKRLQQLNEDGLFLYS